MNKPVKGMWYVCGKGQGHIHKQKRVALRCVKRRERRERRALEAAQAAALTTEQTPEQT